MAAEKILPAKPGLYNSRALPASGDRFPCLAIGGSPPLGLAFVPKLLSLCQRKLNFHFAVLEIHPGGDERQAPLLRLADQLANFVFTHQELAGPQGSVIEDVAVLVRPDMAIEQPQFAIFDQPI